jgi:hypothetical protein
MVENSGGAGRFVRALDSDRVEAGSFWVAFDPDKQSGPRCIEVLFFVAPENGEGAVAEVVELDDGVAAGNLAALGSPART